MVDNLTDFIHARYRATDEKLDRISAGLDAAASRLGSLETRVTALEGAIAHVHERFDILQKQNDRTNKLLERIATRLELVDA